MRYNTIHHVAGVNMDQDSETATIMFHKSLFTDR